MGLEQAIDAALLPRVVETGSSTAVSLINAEEDCYATEGVYVDAIRGLLHDRMITVKHVPREANAVAHRLANFSLRDSILHCWIDEGPSWILDVVSDDIRDFGIG